MEEKFGLSKKIIEDLRYIFSKYEEIESAKIFGSRARGDFKKQSDIDIALFGDRLDYKINTKIFYEIEELYLPYKIDLINFNSIGKSDKIRDSILKEGVEIYAK